MKKILLLFALLLQLFTVKNAVAQCFAAPNGQWPTAAFTPTCAGTCTIQNITTSAWTGEYSVVNVVAGNTYTFRSSVTTHFITISNSTGTTAFAFGVGGTAGITWVSTITGTVRFYTHLSSACNSNTTSHTRRVCCVSSPCSGTLVTLNMTDTWGDGWNGAQFRLQEAGGTVYGPFTISTGLSGTQSICLPNGCYRVILTGGIYPGEIGWSLTNGATTYASATAPNAAPFNTLFTIGGASCPAVPSNDLCANAPNFDLGVNPNQSHTGTGVGSTNTLGLTQHSQTWVSIVVPCDGMSVSMNFCGNTPVRNNAFINLFSDCGANPTLTTFTNANTTSCTNGSVTLNWNNLAASTYYYPILIDNIAWPGAYTLNISGVCPVILPIDLIYFGAEYDKNNKDVNVNWGANVTNLDEYFIVEKSSDSHVFDSIGVVFPTEIGTNDYTFIDGTTIYNGYTYYRLKMVERNNHHYSNTIAIEVNDIVNKIIVLPNPFNDYIKVQNLGDYNGPCEVKIYNNTGIEVISQSFQLGIINKTEINTKDLSPGVYNVVIKTNRNTETHKIVK